MKKLLVLVAAAAGAVFAMKKKGAAGRKSADVWKNATRSQP